MNVEHELRHELQGVLVPYDAERAEQMARVATQAALLDARRRWRTPLAAAATVVVVGGGATALAANESGHGGTAPAGGNTSPASTPASSPSSTPSGTATCGRTENVQSCITKCQVVAVRSHGTWTLAIVDNGGQLIGNGHKIECGPAK